MRGYLPAIRIDDEAPGGSVLGPDGLPEDQEVEEFLVKDVADAEQARIANKAISKVSLLRHSNEYLLRVRARMERRDAALREAREEILRLRIMLASAGITIEAGPAMSQMQSSDGGKTAPAKELMDQYRQLTGAAEQAASKAAPEAGLPEAPTASDKVGLGSADAPIAGAGAASASSASTASDDAAANANTSDNSGSAASNTSSTTTTASGEDMDTSQS